MKKVLFIGVVVMLAAGLLAGGVAGRDRACPTVPRWHGRGRGWSGGPGGPRLGRSGGKARD